jgi:hypothetical protein
MHAPKTGIERREVRMVAVDVEMPNTSFHLFLKI